MCPELELNWTKEAEYLGVKIAITTPNTAKYNYSVKIDKLKCQQPMAKAWPIVAWDNSFH